MKKTILISLLTILLALNNFYLKANPEPSSLVKQFLTWSFMAERNLYDGRLIMRFKEEINLSIKQKYKIENLMLTFEEKSIIRGAEIKVKELHFASYIKSENIDREKVEKMVREINQMRINFSITYLNYLLDVREILTYRQLTILNKIKSRIKDIIKRKDILQRRKRE